MTGDAPAEEEARPLPAWKKGLLAVAVAAVGLGLYLRFSAEEAAPEPPPETSVAASEPSARVPTNSLTGTGNAGAPALPPASVDAPAERSEDEPEHPWSTFLVHGGASFLAAFFIGSVARRFVKTVALFFAVVGLVFVGLAAMGIVELNRADLQEQSTEAVEGIADASGKLARFLTGLLPSSALAAVGLAVGFKRD